MTKISNNIFLSDGKLLTQEAKLNVLSLFDGISCGQVALEKAGIDVNKYFASEIDKHAIKVTQANYPNTIQLGNVEFVTKEMVNHKINLLIGGSPCQGFSFSGKQLNFEDPRSKLFFEFVRLVKELKPKYWLLENVVMKQEYQDVISKYLGVEPIKLNSTLTSAQNRVRLYWANFEITEPKDQGIKLQDVLETTEMIGPSAIRGRRLNKATILGRRLDSRGKRQDYDKTIPITQCLEVRATNTDKSNCLTTVAKDTVLTTMPIGRHPDAFNKKLPYRNYTKIERCRLMNLPDNYCDEISLNQTVKATGNGWDVGMITHILKGMSEKKEGKKKILLRADTHEPPSLALI
ncbi:DNA (cytosine-5-)-methyltransferase [Seonamhaeicola sp.]|uniref:DNA (cytosine-5-)-methyltransferase n=1 Tax=Seonamhaeicola sp. TaxID=1912245 RepID=UPI003564653A